MATFNIELTLEEMQELHVTLVVRVGELRESVHSDNDLFAQASMRQLERSRPLLYYVESVMREHNSAKA